VSLPTKTKEVKGVPLVSAGRKGKCRGENPPYLTNDGDNSLLPSEGKKNSDEKMRWSRCFGETRMPDGRREGVSQQRTHLGRPTCRVNGIKLRSLPVQGWYRLVGHPFLPEAELSSLTWEPHAMQRRNESNLKKQPQSCKTPNPPPDHMEIPRGGKTASCPWTPFPLSSKMQLKGRTKKNQAPMGEDRDRFLQGGGWWDQKNNGKLQGGKFIEAVRTGGETLHY